MLELYWYCEGMRDADRQFVAERLQELGEFLQRPPISVGMNAEELPSELADEVVSVLRKTAGDSEAPFALDYVRPIRKKIAHHENPLLIYCRADSEIAKAAQTENPGAVWGLCSEPPRPLVCAVYKRGKRHILWHEVLHLFDAVDCYCYANPQAGPNCELTNCLMQYVPTESTVGEWPFLCRKNIIRIQNWSKKHKQDES